MITIDGVNNGAGLTDAAYIALQTAALNKGISSAYWTGSFNNNAGARSVQPSQRGQLKPFTNDPGLRNRLVTMLTSRPKGK
jgi:hypothetical protein